MFIMISFARSSIPIRQRFALQTPANCQGSAGLPSSSPKQRYIYEIQGKNERITQQLLAVPQDMLTNSMLTNKCGFVGS